MKYGYGLQPDRSTDDDCTCTFIYDNSGTRIDLDFGTLDFIQ